MFLLLCTPTERLHFNGWPYSDELNNTSQLVAYAIQIWARVLLKCLDPTWLLNGKRLIYIVKSLIYGFCRRAAAALSGLLRTFYQVFSATDQQETDPMAPALPAEQNNEQAPLVSEGGAKECGEQASFA